MTVIRPRMLDLFCGAGGAAMGYYQAGFDVVGVDIVSRPRYPFQFVQADAMTLGTDFLAGFDVIHASPPCQAYTLCQRIQQRKHPNLVAGTRAMIRRTGLPYVIENVEGAPLVDPFTLCGAMFPGLRVYRHRLFETNFSVHTPSHPHHYAPITKMGRPVRSDTFMHVVGNFSGTKAAREAMGISWMTRDELREAIPPAYTRYIGKQLLARL